MYTYQTHFYLIQDFILPSERALWQVKAIGPLPLSKTARGLGGGGGGGIVDVQYASKAKVG